MILVSSYDYLDYKYMSINCTKPKTKPPPPQKKEEIPPSPPQIKIFFFKGKKYKMQTTFEYLYL